MALIRVFMIPFDQLPHNYHFGGGEEVQLQELDWFRDDSMSEMPIERWREELIKFISKKRYWSAEHVYLVLHGGGRTFTINYTTE